MSPLDCPERCWMRPRRLPGREVAEGAAHPVFQYVVAPRWSCVRGSPRDLFRWAGRFSLVRFCRFVHDAPMGITAKMCRVDEDERVVFDGEEADALGLDDEGYLALDKSWGALQTMVVSVTAIDPFAEELLDASKVEALARVLKPLIWRKALDTCEVPEHEDPEDLKVHFIAFRNLVLAAADEGSGLRCEFL
jgi:hypothetical protein